MYGGFCGPSKVFSTTAESLGLTDLSKSLHLDSTVTSEEINSIMADDRVTDIYLTAGTYTLKEIRLKSNVNFILDENAIINVDGLHLFYNFETTDTDVLLYNGHGNIRVSGGTINGHGGAFIHGSNITFENINFNDSHNDHYFEICSCRNFTINNCHFKGMVTQDVTREYVEYIQLDQPSYVGFPHLGDANSPTFDTTPNTCIYITNCTFDKGTTEGYSNIYTAIGSHGSGAGMQYQTHIVIKDNKFLNCTHAAIAQRGWKYVTVEHNEFEYCESALQLMYGNSDITFKDNKVNNANNAIYTLNDNNSTFYFLKINGNKFDNCTHRLHCDIVPQDGVTPNINGGQIKDSGNRIEDSGTDIIRYKSFYEAVDNEYVRINEAAGYVILLDNTSDSSVTLSKFSQITLKEGESSFNICRITGACTALMIDNNRSDQTMKFNAALEDGSFVNSDANTKLLSNISVDVVIDTGRYFGYDCTDTPTDVESGRFTLEVNNRNGYLSQVLIKTYSSEIFIRTKHDTWKPWVKLSSTSYVDSQFGLVKECIGQTLNTFISNGRYYGYNCTDTPEEVGAGIFTMNIIGTGTNYVSQELILLYSNRKFIRTFHTTWKPWVECSNNTFLVSSISLNTLNKPGTYYGYNCTDTPADVASGRFILRVEAYDVYVTQTLDFLYYSKKYSRTFYTDWKAWSETSNTALTTHIADTAKHAVYSITKLATPVTGYISSYRLTADGVNVGDVINIPKDFLVKSGSVKTCTVNDNPVVGYVVGDKYIDFVVNSIDNDATNSNIYIKVSDLIVNYTNGNGISITDTSIAVKIDSVSANGLSVSTDGIALALATSTTAGAMSSVDKVNLNSNTADRHAHTNKTILDDITASFTTEKDNKLSNVMVGADVNIIEDVRVNGVSLEVIDKSVNIVFEEGILIEDESSEFGETPETRDADTLEGSSLSDITTPINDLNNLVNNIFISKMTVSYTATNVLQYTSVNTIFAIPVNCIVIGHNVSIAGTETNWWITSIRQYSETEYNLFLFNSFPATRNGTLNVDIYYIPIGMIK